MRLRDLAVLYTRAWIPEVKRGPFHLGKGRKMFVTRVCLLDESCSVFQFSTIGKWRPSKVRARALL
jgi:hypothetical protein